PEHHGSSLRPLSQSLPRFSSTIPHPPTPPLFPYTTLFRSSPSLSIALCPCPLRAGHRRTLPPGEDPARAATGIMTDPAHLGERGDRKSTRLNSSHVAISYAVFCLKKKNVRRRLPAEALSSS